jgi:hypothetical protein
MLPSRPQSGRCPAPGADDSATKGVCIGELLRRSLIDAAFNRTTDDCA